MGSWGFDFVHGWQVNEVNGGGVIDGFLGAGGVELATGFSERMLVSSEC